MTGSRDDLYFRQLLAGRDFAESDVVATQMVNFCYLIGDRAAGEALVVDPAWDVEGLVAIADRDEMQLVGALATHYHPDHIGGELFGHVVEGLARLLELKGMKVHVQREEAQGVRFMTGLSDSDLVLHDGGDRVRVGEVDIELVHTPGHTPGSQCFLVRDRLVSGDTLFVKGCGRVDLPGGDPEEMYRSLTERLAKLSDDVVLYPGHDYGDRPTSTLGEERQGNYYLRVPNLEDWLRLMGRA
ncbi:MAG TPA: MBL fold metallo-hydrolase [Vicinamibacteria bacterium]|jgi:glyoxylase-like metal-dependent hydrolase (beta-lactamase superfamily II)